MKQYKYTELLLNAVLIMGSILCFAITLSFEWLLLSYFIVGGIQLLSMSIHIIKGWFSKHYLRLGYYFFLIIVAMLCFGTIGWFLLLYVAPLMAAFYMFICYREWKILKFKELVHLK